MLTPLIGCYGAWQPMSQTLLLVVLLWTSVLPALAQSIRYVKSAATGSSWTNASGNLQAMIDASTTSN